MEGVQHLKIPFDEIKLATSNFSDENSIGKGGYGKVYAATLSLFGQQRTVAIKRLNLTSQQGEREFLMEIQLLSCYRHKNLISLVGFCDENGEKILVYEYAKHGSLDRYLSSSELSWKKRLQISIGAARGFSYLHNDVGPQHRVLHRDIKSSNVLLDENWEAKISDFGLSKIGPSNVECTFLLTSACGTIGYVDPEYARTGILTKESDVYSFGVVLFEILCGRPVRNKDKSLFLPALARKHYEQNTLIDIIHPNLKTQVKLDSLEMFSMVAYQCLKENRSERPTMSWIVEKLEKALELQVDIKAAKHIRIGTWGGQSGEFQNDWSYELEQDAHLSKITIHHGDGIYSLMFSSELGGLSRTSNKVGGWASGDKVSEVKFDGDEEIIGINGTVGTRGNDIIISSLSFKTNKRIHGPFGQAGEPQFSIPWEGGRFVGVYGVAGPYIDSIGVYVKAYEEIIKVGTWGMSKPSDTQIDSQRSLWSFQLERNHHLKSITIDHGDHIYSLMFTSEHKGLLHTSGRAGGWNGGEGGATVTEVTFDWNEEICAINGTIGLSREQHNAGQTIISSLSLITNKKGHGPFGQARGTPFTVPWEDCSLVGFYGLGGWYINSIGVYLKTTT